MFTYEELTRSEPSTGVISRAPFDRHSRRSFLKRFGGGILIAVTLTDRVFAAEAEAPIPRGGRPGVPTDFNAFLRIGEDGRVTGLTGKIEMGQGIVTSLAQMLADELDVPFDDVEMIMGDTDLCPWDAGTWGSMTTRAFGPLFRAAIAEARAVLLELASETLNVPTERLVARDGVIFDRDHEASRVSYAELAKGRTIDRHLTVKPDLKDVAQFRIMGQSMLRRDSRDKVTGAAKYTGDHRVPGMLYASILRPPSHAASRTSVDTSAARAVPGVVVVEEDDLIATLHELPDVAAKARDLIKADYDVPASTLNDETIFDHLRGRAPDGRTLQEGGNLADGRRQATQTFEQTYLDGYVAHAPMETHAALAQIEDGKATVWASTQNPFGARDIIARSIGFQAEDVRVITPFLGGGFGGKTSNGQTAEAARLAQATGRPVMVMRTREEEFFYDTFRPAALVDITSGLDESGRIAFWNYEVLFAGARGAEHFYTIPHHRTEARPGGWTGGPGTHPFGTGAWRAPSNNTNTFARESHLDVMAAAAGTDSIEFRLQHLDDERMLRVLRTAAEKFGWTAQAGPSGRGWGVACGIDAGTYVAGIAEVAVDEDSGQVQVKRVLIAQDMGIIINPQGARIQLEGCVTMGLGYALTETVHFEGGRVLDDNFHRYELPRFAGVPKIEAVFVENNDVAPQGGGEPAIILMGALIANAIFDATGARLVRLPMTSERVKAALAAREATSTSSTG